MVLFKATVVYRIILVNRTMYHSVKLSYPILVRCGWLNQIIRVNTKSCSLHPNQSSHNVFALSLTGAPSKGIIRSQKREKSTCFFVGQRYYWTKGLRIELLASLHGSIGFEVSSVKNAQKVFPRLDLLAELDCWDGLLAGYCEWICIQHGSFCTTVPSTR